MKFLRRAIVALSLSPLVAGCASSESPISEAPSPQTKEAPAIKETQPANDVGVLIMAHGGGDEWNTRLGSSVDGLRTQRPTAIAFGMANPMSLAAATDSLIDQGASRIAVVRIFLSGTSFINQTEYLLGLSPTPPTYFLTHTGIAEAGHEPKPIARDVVFATHLDGLSEYEGLADILLDRANEISQSASDESILILAHGVGNPDENKKLLNRMTDRTHLLRGAEYQDIHVETLREDWPEERELAEARIREFVSAQNDAGRNVLVLPFRVAGFGPYAEILEGLDYTPGRSLLPHAKMGEWIEAVADKIICAENWASGAGCGSP